LVRVALQTGLYDGSALLAAFLLIKLIIVTRVLVGAHYLEDALAGTAVGIAIGVIVPRLIALA
jgi:membrane-associated phospholipid phosphatase